MCGIAGIVGDESRTAEVRVTAMLGTLARRGPDSEGMVRLDAAVLGHRRLSVFDLSDAGRQPMITDDHQLAVVFNGAVYNFLELRHELEGSGVRFRSNTDTEVLLHGYRAWGIDRLVERLRGMFAFALLDRTRQQLFLVRDRLGVKPLLFRCNGGTIAFASTARALRVAGECSAINPIAVAEFLEYGYVTDSRCIYQGVEKLPAATILEWSNGELSLRRYWQPPAIGSEALMSFSDAVDRTEELLLDSVRRRLHADVPVGALLSGGIDSALVCWAVAQVGGEVSAFTIGSPGAAGDESADAAATAHELGLDHKILALGDDSPGSIEDLISAYAEPFAVESALGMLRLSQMIRDAGITVLLTGDGGDDVFLGYPRHRQLLMVQRLAARAPSSATALWKSLRAIVPRAGPLRRAVHLTDYVVGGLPAYLEAHEGLPAYRARGLLGERLLDVTIEQRERSWSTASARRLLTEYLEHDLQHQFVAEYLTKVDGGTMHYALEARSPFLDQELWEFASALPVESRLHGGELKAILREVARRNIGPRVASLRKRGFTIPVRDWMARGWHSTVDHAFRDSVLAKDGWIDGGRVRAELNSVSAGGSVSQQLWYLFVLELWVRADRGLDAGETARESKSAIA